MKTKAARFKVIADQLIEDLFYKNANKHLNEGESYVFDWEVQKPYLRRVQSIFPDRNVFKVFKKDKEIFLYFLKDKKFILLKTFKK